MAELKYIVVTHTNGDRYAAEIDRTGKVTRLGGPLYFADEPTKSTLEMWIANNLDAEDDAEWWNEETEPEY